MRYLNRTINKIRVAVLKVITAVMALILILCMSTVDGDLKVWIPLFMVSAGWIFLVLLANGYLTCGDCKDKNKCMERSRNYPCRDFKRKEKNEGTGNSPADHRVHDRMHDVLSGGSIQQVQQV